MNEEADKLDAEAADDDELEGRSSRAKDTAAAVNSKLRDFWLHLRVWIPFLHNPFDRKRLVKFAARDARVGMEWTIHMPRQCWRCGETESLRTKNFEADLRCYEYALPILGGMLAGVLVGLLLICWLTLFSFIFIALVLLGGLVVLRLKSWPEYVSMTMSACPKHLEGMVMPDAVSEDNELYVYALSTTQATAARAELKDARNRGRRAADAGGGGGRSDTAPSGPASEASDSQTAGRSTPYLPPAAPREDLPPIKLAGEEDDPPAARPSIGEAPETPTPEPERSVREELPPIKIADDDDVQAKDNDFAPKPKEGASDEELPPIKIAGDDVPAKDNDFAPKPKEGASDAASGEPVSADGESSDDDDGDDLPPIKLAGDDDDDDPW